MKTLEKTGKADNTVVIFTTDHGDLMGDHGFKRGKLIPYEGAIRVPLVIRSPWNNVGEHRRHLTSHIDILYLTCAPKFSVGWLLLR